MKTSVKGMNILKLNQRTELKDDKITKININIYFRSDVRYYSDIVWIRIRDVLS